MPTSDGSVACSVCGEVPSDRIDWGCVFCNADKGRSARQPEIPVNPGPDGVGCIAHHELNCERCGLIEARHRLAIDPWEQTEPGGSWSAPRSGRGLGAVALVLAIMLLASACFWVVSIRWPR